MVHRGTYLIFIAMDISGVEKTTRLSPSQLETFAKRALVWKHRQIIQEEAELADVDPLEVAAKAKLPNLS